MTNDEHYATNALVAYLTRVDIQLARSGLSIAERDSVCRQLAEEFHDLLAASPNDATPEQVEAVLAKLGSDAAFVSDDVASRGQTLRMFWNRFWIGIPAPLALNHQGRRQILWPELIKRLIFAYGLIISTNFVLCWLLMGKVTSVFFTFVVLFAVMLPLGLVRVVLRTPVESLPRAEHWPTDRMQRYQFTTTLIIFGSVVLVVVALIGLYVLLTALNGPANPALFLAVMLLLGGVGMLICFWEAWRRCQRRQQFQRWSQGLLT